MLLKGISVDLLLKNCVRSLIFEYEKWSKTMLLEFSINIDWILDDFF